jgi:hypothetical protein
MEIVAHALWATAAAKATNRNTAKLGILWLVVWTMFPDLLAFSPDVIAGLWHRLTGSGAGDVLDFHHVGTLWGAGLYELGHSLVVFLAVFIIVWVMHRRPLWEMFGWALHILLDIPSHSAHYPTPFLWPVSTYYIAGVSWRQWWFTALNYGILAAAFLALRMNQIKRRLNRTTQRQETGPCPGIGGNGDEIVATCRCAFLKRNHPIWDKRPVD